MTYVPKGTEHVKGEIGKLECDHMMFSRPVVFSQMALCKYVAFSFATEKFAVEVFKLFSL